MKRIILSTLAVLFAVLLLWLAFNWKHIRAFPEIISSFYAKEMCSCLYVVGRLEQACHDYARQYVPIQQVWVDKQAKTVKVKGLWRTNQARFVNRRFGCILDPL